MIKEPENTNKELLKLKQELIELNCRISTQQEHIQKLCLEVEEREKELRFHHKAEKIINNAALSPEKIFQKIVDILPEAFQFPEITAISLKINGWIFNSKEFIDSNIFIEANIQIENSLIGFIKACYKNDGHQKISKKFLKEEKDLLKILSKRLSEYYVKYLNDLELKKNEDKYQSLVDNINDVIYEITADGTLKYINNAAFLISGYHPNELIGKSYFENIYPNDLPLVYKALSELGNEKYIHVEFRYLAKDGNIKWVRSSTKPILENGIAIGGRGVLIDIHETKTAQILLAQNEKKLQFKTRLQELLVDISNKYINLPLNQLDFKINKSLGDLGKFIGADRFYIFDYDFENKTCSNTYEWCAEGIEAQIDELQNVPFEYFPEWLNAHCKGETLYVEDVLALDPEDNLRIILEPQGIKSLVAVPIMDADKCIGFTGFDAVIDYHTYSSEEVELLKVFAQMLVNIKNRLKIQQELEDSNHKLNLLINNLSGVIYRSKFDGENWKLEYLSKGVFELTGYTENEFLNNPKVAFKNLIHKDDQKRERSVIDEHLLSKLPFEIEYRVLNLNGEEKWVLDRGRGIYEDDKLVALEGFILDITDKTKFETDLILKEVRYLQLLEHSKTVIWEVDMNGLYTYVSPTSESVYGHRDDELIGKKHFYDIAAKEFRKDVKKYGVESIRRGDEMVNYDNAIEKKDETIIWVTTNGKPYYDKNNIIIGYRGSDIDITERKLAEDELRKNEEELNQAQEIAKMGSWYLNLITNETTLSKNYYKLVEREEKDIIKKSDLLFPLIYEDDLENLNNVVEKIKETKTLGSSNVRLVMPNGNPKWFESTIVPVYENGILIALKGVKVDISEKIVQENEIKKLTIAIEQSPIAIVITNLDATIEYVSPAFQKITGYSKEEVIGKKPSILKSGQTSDTVYKNLWTTISEGKIWKGEWVNKNKNGDLYWESISITPIQDENKLTTGYLALKEDITEQKNAAKEIIELNANLEVKIDERTLELQQTNNILQQEIEQRKQIEVALSKSEYNYRSVIENVNEVIFKTDANGLWLFLNKSWEEITGFTVEESLGKLFVNYVHPEDRQRNTDLFTPLIDREKEYCRHQVRYLTKDGGFRWIEVFARLGINEFDEITGTYGTLNDITERKKAEEALEIEKQRLASIIEGTNVGTWEWNIKTGETKFNERWANILGYSLEEISPISIETWIKFSHPEDLHKSNELLQMHFQGTLDYYSFESRMKHRNGSWIWVLDRGKVNKWDNDGKPLLMSGTHHDITEQKEAEEELNWNKTLLELMSNSSPLGFLVVDNRTDDILYFNQRFCQIWEIEELTGQMARGELKNNDIIPYCLPVLADVPAFAESCKPLQFEDNRIILEDEIAFTKNRTTHRYTTQIRGIKDEYFGRFYIFEDITERKIADKEILNAKNEAVKANKAKSEFLSRMSHELRTPLTSILGFSQLLKMSNLNEAHKTNVNYIYSSGKHLLNLINEVLDISKIEAGKISLSIKPIQVSALLNEVIDTLQPQVNNMNINLKVLDSSCNELYVNADMKRLKQVLLNLLDNAIKYNKKSGFVKVFTKIMPKNSIGIAPLRISIMDTGVGISTDDISKIFTPFERIGAERTEIEGTGLGLSVVKKLIDAMGGKIGVESVLDKGSTFWFELPLAESAKTGINLANKETKLKAALAVAKKELAFQNEEKGKRAHELEIANIELDFQIEEKVKRAHELEIANIELDFQNEEKGKRADELEIANKELAFQNEEKGKRAEELVIAHKEISDLKGRISKTAKNFVKKPCTILYVEDNIFNIKLVENILNEQYAPINLITDITGSEAVKLAIENQPDLILLDLDLPFIQGSEILELLSKEEKTKRIPVVILTTNILPKQREKLLKEGAKEYINKPIDIPVFLKVLEAYII